MCNMQETIVTTGAQHDLGTKMANQEAGNISKRPERKIMMTENKYEI